MAEDQGELIEGLQKRKPEALAAAYDRYGQIVYSLFLRITRDQSAAEDLVQELFIRVWNNAGHFNAAKGSFGVWILSIARHMAIDHVRSAQSRFATRLRPLEDAERVRSGSEGETQESILDQVRTVGTAFSYLNFNQKRVLELAYYEGFSQTEIAAKLNEPLGTVKSWMRSGLVRLRTAVKGGGVK
jgi:RNA polymerase sigma-70 factor (ECF subfamily)